MNSVAPTNPASETSRLLAELDHAIDRSGLMRDILRRYEQIRQIESLTGPSQITRVMRKELQILEQRLRGLHGGPAEGSLFSAA